MHHHRLRPLTPALAAGLLLLAAGPVHGQTGPGYTFTRVIDSSGPFGQFSDATLNNAGQVAFIAFTDGSVFTRTAGIYTGPVGGPFTPVIRQGDLYRTYIDRVEVPLFDDDGNPIGIEIIESPRDVPYTSFVQPVLNDAGQVAFGARAANNNQTIEVAPAAGGPRRVVIDSETSPFASFRNQPALNNAGAVAFVAQTGALRSTATLQVSVPGSPLAAALSTPPEPAEGIRQELDLNDLGEITFLSGGTYRLSPGNPPVLLHSGLNIEGFTLPVINDFGQSAVGLLLSDNVASQVLRTDRGVAGSTTIVRQDGTETPNRWLLDGAFGPVSINDLGQVSFFAQESGLIPGVPRGTALYTGSGSGVLRLLGTGDLLDGRQVASVFGSSQAIDDVGRMVVHARFTDGSEGIYLASPIAIPEPALVAVGAGALALGLAVGRRRRR